VTHSEQEDVVATPRSSRISQRRSAALADGGADYSSRRAELIRVAANVFREKGYAAATLNDVAAVLGTDRASLYYYIGSKEELFQECITAAVTDNIAKADAISAMDVSPRDRLLHLIELVINSQVEHYPYMYVYMQEDMRQVVSQDAAWATEMVEATHRIEGYFISAIKDGIADGSFRDDLSTTLVANSLFGMTQWTHRWFVPGKKYTAEDLIHTFATLFFAGIDNPRGRAAAEPDERPRRISRTPPGTEKEPRSLSRKATA
jgi:TetR/AcrR family transcriptional regulator, cholesterol catabolism regulator